MPVAAPACEPARSRGALRDQLDEVPGPALRERVTELEERLEAIGAPEGA